MKLLILAGGYGTRLYPIIKDTPKALLEVAGKTLIDHTVDKFVSVPGIEEVLVVTNAKFAGMLGSWASSRKGLPFPVRVINDGTRSPEERLGAIGDILFVLGQEKKASDWVVAGSDNLFDGKLDGFVSFSQGKASPVIGCFDIKDAGAAVKYGVIELNADGRIVSLEEKPSHPRTSLISMCLYYFPKETLHFFKDFIDATNNPDTTGGYIQWLFQKAMVYGFKFSGKWYDIGSVESYNEAQKNFLQ